MGIGSIFKGSGKPALKETAKEAARSIVDSFSFSGKKKQKTEKEPLIKRMAKSLIKPPGKEPMAEFVRLEEITVKDTTQSIIQKIYKMMVKTFEFKETYFDSLYKFHVERELEEKQNFDEMLKVLSATNFKPIPKKETVEEETEIEVDGKKQKKKTKSKKRRRKGKLSRVSRKNRPSAQPVSPAPPVPPAAGGPRTNVPPAAGVPPVLPSPPAGTPGPSVPPAGGPRTNVPPARPSAERIPSAPPKYDGYSAGQVRAIISSHEGKPHSVYGDYIDKVTKQIRNDYGLRPEEWSEKYLNQRKSLTDFTLNEVMQYQKYRLKASGKSTAAVGMVGFMPTTLFGSKLDGSSGLVRDSGLSMDTKFTKETQELLDDVKNEQQDKVLKAYGVKNITPSIKLMANYLGAYGAILVLKAAQMESDRTVADVLMNGVTGLRGTGRDPTEGNVINKELNTTKVKDFITRKEQFVQQQIQKFQFEKQIGKDVTPTPAAAPIGAVTTEKLATSTIENKEIRKYLEEQLRKDMIQTFNNISISSTKSSNEKSTVQVYDRPAFEIKRDGNGYITQRQ